MEESQKWCLTDLAYRHDSFELQFKKIRSYQDEEVPIFYIKILITGFF